MSSQSPEQKQLQLAEAVPEEKKKNSAHRFEALRFNRRKMLEIMAKAFGITVAALSIPAVPLAFDRYLLPRRELLNDWERINVDLETFLENEPWLKNVNIGCSVSPEQLEWLFGAAVSPAEFADFLELMNVTEVRFGTRWNNTVVPGTFDQVDLSKYREWIQVMIDRGIKVCLNVGPIKVFRWPEDHLPQALLDELKKTGDLPEKGGTIAADSKLANIALRYLTGFCAALKKEWPGVQFSFQPENEAFTAFGEHEWVASSEYLTEVIRIIHLHFPSSNILLNTPASPDLKKFRLESIQSAWRKTVDFAMATVERFTSLPGQLIVGADYYFDTPNSLQLSADRFSDAQFAVAAAEGRYFVPRTIEDMKLAGIRTEITELQGEEWEDHILAGNSLQAAQFAILRSANFTDAKTQRDDEPQKILRYWGFEQLFKRFKDGTLTDEQKQIMKLNALINLRKR